MVESDACLRAVTVSTAFEQVVAVVSEVVYDVVVVSSGAADRRIDAATLSL